MRFSIRTGQRHPGGESNQSQITELSLRGGFARPDSEVPTVESPDAALPGQSPENFVNPNCSNSLDGL